MGKFRIAFSVVLFLTILTLSFIGGGWNQSFAQGTIPTVPTEKPPVHPPGGGEELPKVTCIGGRIAPDKELDLFVVRNPRVKDSPRWGGVLFPTDSACEPADAIYCIIPVRYLPKRSSMFYYRQGVEVYQRVKGEIRTEDSCAPKLVYFDLTRYERFMYDKFNDRFGFYMYNPDTSKWELCPEVVFDKEAGEFGRLTCRTVKWGYFALGWPAKK